MNEDKYNPLLSQRDIEHNTYIRVKYEYMEMKEKRDRVNKTGIIFIAVSAVVFLFLMFSLESKLFFLILWIITILFVVSYLIRNEYKFYKLRVYLGYENESESEKNDNDEESED